MWWRIRNFAPYHLRFFYAVVNKSNVFQLDLLELLSITSKKSLSKKTVLFRRFKNSQFFPWNCGWGFLFDPSSQKFVTSKAREHSIRMKLVRHRRARKTSFARLPCHWFFYGEITMSEINSWCGRRGKSCFDYCSSQRLWRFVPFVFNYSVSCI